MNLGIIGYGYTGQQHARALSTLPGAKLAAVSETDPARTADLSLPVFEDYHDLLREEAIQAVTVCLPHFLHEQVAADALDAGKHVLVEKPLAVSVAAGERLCRLAERASKVLMVEMTHRFMPPIIEARRLVQNGAIGQVLAVTDTVVESIGLFGSLPAWMLSRTQAGGGVGLTSGIHLIDHVAWIVGKPLSLRSAWFGCSQALGDVEDTAVFSLTAGDDTPVQVLLNWRREGQDLEGEITLYGTRGTLRVDCWGGWKLQAAQSLRQQDCFAKGSSIAVRALVGMRAALEEFVAAVSQGRRPDPRPEESLVSQRLIEQAYTLAGTG
ncbi:MAG: Gfo/Idh/MocA family oxidoreductase [Acidobacteriota bacterium]